MEASQARASLQLSARCFKIAYHDLGSREKCPWQAVFANRLAASNMTRDCAHTPEIATGAKNLSLLAEMVPSNKLADLVTKRGPDHATSRMVK